MNSLLDEWSYIVILSAAGVYVGAFLAYAFDMAARADSGTSRRTRPGTIASALLWLGFLLHGAGVLLRGISAGVVPWATMYEFTITATLMIAGVYAFAGVWVNLRYLGVFVTGFIVLALAIATVFFWRPTTTLAVALDSYWLLIHVVVAMLGTAFFALGTGLAGMQLLKSGAQRRAARAAQEPGDAEAAAPLRPGDLGEADFAEAAPGAVGSTTLSRSPAGSGGEPEDREGRRGRLARFLASLPGIDDLEQMSYRANIIGFVFWTFTLIFGALWAQKAWGRYWGWDVKEVWTFIIWTIYAGYLHARATRGWRGDRAAWLAIAGFLAIIFNFTIVNIFFKGWHAYSGL